MSNKLFELFLNATWETLYMVFIAGIIGIVLGIPLGILLFITRPKGMLENTWLYQILSTTVNATRSIPFIILLVAIIPFTRFIIGTSIGTTAAIVPLSIGAIPFVARLIENTLLEIPNGLIEVGHVMGASPLQIITKILLPEALPGIINVSTMTLITLVNYSAMAGVVGGGGLGDFAIRYGYQRFDTMLMVSTVVILIVIVQCIQYIGDYFARKTSYTK